MDFYDVVTARRSVRGYRPDPIPAEKLARIEEAIQLAPTACNLQPFRFLFLKSSHAKQPVCACYTQPWFAEAPVVVVALGNRETAWKRFDGTSAHTIDVAIAMEHLVLAATAEGLGTCWVCAFDQKKLTRKLDLAPEWEPVALTPLGYPAVAPEAKPRKPITEIIVHE